MNEVFCNCDRCKKDILVGDQMVSITMSRDFIESEAFVQPIEAQNQAVWCLSCAPLAILEITPETFVGVQPMEDFSNLWGAKEHPVHKHAVISPNVKIFPQSIH